MSTLTVYIEDRVIQMVAELAREHGRTLDQEVADLLETALCIRRRAFWDDVDGFRARFEDRVPSDSVALIREDRDA